MSKTAKLIQDWQKYTFKCKSETRTPILLGVESLMNSDGDLGRLSLFDLGGLLEVLGTQRITNFAVWNATAKVVEDQVRLRKWIESSPNTCPGILHQYRVNYPFVNPSYVENILESIPDMVEGYKNVEV
jgi:hypothetical protein